MWGSKAGWNITNVTAPPRPWAWSPAQSGSRAARSISPISCIPLWPRRLRRSIRSLHREQVSTYGVAVVPLKDCEQTPDVVIVMTNAYQSMRMVQGYEYGTGKKPAIDMGAMQGMCSELTISPYLTGEMNVSVLCPSTRMLCKWSENDMAVGIPYELFEQIVEGVEATQPNY